MTIYKVPKGFRDFPPDIMILRKRVMATIEKVFIKYGFDPFETPAIEYWETLKGKYGDEVESKLVYKFQDPWSETWFALRYDLTVPLARFVASSSVALPFKRYHIGRVWRHESPQKGRYREFWQCDADIIGSPYPEADAEIINLIIDVMSAFNITGYTIRVNDRRLLTGIFEEGLGLGSYGRERMLAIFRAIDKLDKIGVNGVRSELEALKLPQDHIDRIMNTILISGNYNDILSEISSRFPNNEKIKVAVQHLEEMFELIKDHKRVVFDLSMVRGLDYYTGPIFETYVEEPKIGSLTGGGRYDDLIKRYGGPDLPATGTSFGIERIIDAGLELGLFKLDKKTYTSVCVVCLDPGLYKFCWEITNRLRDSGIATQVDLMRRKERKQREYCESKNIPYVIFIGHKEKESSRFTVFDRENQRRYENLTLEEVIQLISSSS
ncbi:MAG: histidine--tRNA ligase [Crenarchaeota archaeon]|nr:histidine--tRNA ligase [Thermoproteota archaeon]